MYSSSLIEIIDLMFAQPVGTILMAFLPRDSALRSQQNPQTLQFDVVGFVLPLHAIDPALVYLGSEVLLIEPQTDDIFVAL